MEAFSIIVRPRACHATRNSWGTPFLGISPALPEALEVLAIHVANPMSFTIAEAAISVHDQHSQFTRR